ncbi:MAG: PssD/Cps14F family polysaccharide biosynthesis glycosyltransferase [Promethearchaeota archaeon]|jgi:beta-1,4-N-acetylglucosaminyltransferase
MKKLNLLIVLGEGGHSAELLNLVNFLGNEFRYSYIVSKEDNISISHIRLKGPVYRIHRPRGKQTKIIKAIFKFFGVFINSFKILIKVRPYAILSTGPAIAVPVSVIGKLLRIKIIFVETGSRVQKLSLTGRIMYRFADLFFIQWPQLKSKAPKGIYAGRLI